MAASRRKSRRGPRPAPSGRDLVAGFVDRILGVLEAELSSPEMWAALERSTRRTARVVRRLREDRRLSANARADLREGWRATQEALEVAIRVARDAWREPPERSPPPPLETIQVTPDATKSARPPRRSRPRRGARPRA